MRAMTRTLLATTGILLCPSDLPAGPPAPPPQPLPVVQLRRAPNTGQMSLQAVDFLVRQRGRPVAFRFRGICRFDPTTQRWLEVPWHLLGSAIPIAPRGAGAQGAEDRALVDLPDEVALFWVTWSEDDVRHEAFAASGPILCQDIDLSPAPAGMIATCLPFPDHAEARFVPLPSLPCAAPGTERR